jgi:hypothetical protein
MKMEPEDVERVNSYITEIVHYHSSILDKQIQLGKLQEEAMQKIGPLCEGIVRDLQTIAELQKKISQFY